MRAQSWVAWVWVWGMVVAACAGPVTAEALEGDGHGLSGVLRSEVFAAPLADVSARIDERGVVTFWYADRGEWVAYQKQYEGEVVARPVGAERYQLFLERGRELPPVQLGLLDRGALSICGTFAIDGRERSFGCDALFLHTDQPPAPGARFPAIIGVAETATLRASSTREVVDLREHALRQINQYGTGTCYFNSSAGILEWYYHQQTGEVLNISEPALVGSYTIGEIGDIGDYDILEKTNSLPGAIADAYLPVKSYYTESAGYEDVEQEASQAVRGLSKSKRVDLPFSLELTSLFWYGKWQSGHTTEADYQRAVRWVTSKAQPVHLQHVVSGYWHAVIMLGYNPGTGEVLIKDSLGNTNLKATWRTKQWFMDTTYGAAGVELR